MRVVLDTNILISALWKPDGLEARVVALARGGQIIPYVSAELWKEYREVLCRAKFAKLRDMAENLLVELGGRVTYVRPLARVTWSIDDEDNRVLECLQEARATYLVTGNMRHFPSDWKGAKVVNARGFLSEEFPALGS